MKKLLLTLFATVLMNGLYAQYCIPALDCSFADQINNFSTTGGIQNITNNNSGCNNQPGSYIFYSAQTVSQIQGLSVNFTVQAGPTWGQGFRIWVDWNQDGDFIDPGEDVYTSPSSGTTPYTGTITVPATAIPGITRMRVLCRYATIPANNPCDNSGSFGEIEDYNFDVIASAPCTAPPTAGTAIANVDSICPNVNFNISLSGSSMGSGLSYQWHSGPSATGPWTPIAGATNASYTGSQTTATYYTCVVTCSSQNDTAIADVIYMRPFFNCYCTSNATSTADSKIDSVYFNTIVTGSLTTTCQTYTNYTATQNTTVIKGQPYPIRVRPGTCGGNFTRYGKVYIDYNQDGTFQVPAEEVFTFGPTTTAQQNFNGTVNIPLTATTGVTMMRVVVTETGSLAGVNPCGTYTWGETEDYLVTIIDQPNIDINVRAMTSPVLPPNCYTNCEPVNVRLRNDGLNLIDFTVDPMTVSVNITGANPQLLNTIVNTGSLAVGDSMLVTVAACYDMSAFGTYNFRPYANITADGNPYNDTLNIITINNSNAAGTAALNTGGICFGDSATLTLTGNTGGFQWQSSTDGGVTWVNETGPGNTSSPYIVSPNDTIQYRAIVCGNISSNILTLNVNSVTNASGTGASRCGYGPVTLNASGTGTIKWHTDSIGGNLVHTGNTYSPLVSQTDTFWIENNLVSGSGNVGKPINFSGSGTIVLNRGMVFNTTTEIVLDSVAVYPIGSGTIQIALRNAANVIIATSAVVPVNGAGLGVYVPLNFTIPIGTGYRLTLNATSGYTDLWFDNTGNTFPYNSAGGEISITNGWTGTATSTAYFYFYDWRFSRVCASPRTPVIVTVTPADSIAVTPNPAFSCQGTPVPLTVNSANSNYNYTWSPSNGLSSTTGANVTANPVSNTTYVVSALDALGCTAYDTVTVTVTPVPVIDATIARDEICGNDTTQLGVTLISGGTNVNQIGFGTTSNTTTSYPAPYGNWFWGARHQMLILASELQAQGFNAGPLNDIAFQVSAPNNCPALVNFEIKMGLTTVNNLTVFQTGLTTVHLNPSYQPVTGWNTHLFSSAFVWDGTSNIIIETCFNNSSFIQNASTFYTATGFQSCIYYFADQAGVCSQTAATSTVNRPNMRFTQYNPVLYSWTPSANVNNPNIANPIGTPVANATTTFYVTVTDSISGCPVVDSVSVNTYPVPQPNLGPNINVCQGQQFVIDAGSTFNTYLWNTGSIGQLIIVNGIATPTTYWVDVTNNYGCTNRDSITVSVNPSPNINLGNDTAICKNHTLTLNAGSGFSSYLWSNGATTPSITIPQGSITSVYYVTVTNAFGCSDTDTILVTVSPCTGIDELDGSQGTVLLYPNPNQGLFNMVIDIPGADNALVEIVNVQGRIVYSTNISNTMAYKDVIDLSANASGIYYVRVISDKYSNISKLMINN
jgi:hypothetical protein